MCNDISLASLVCSVLAKDDAKLLKQQLFNYFWQYVSIGASLWSLNISTRFEFLIGTWNILNVFLYFLSSWIWKGFLWKLGPHVLKFSSIQSKLSSNQRYDLAYWPWNLNLASFLFLFAAMNSKSFQRRLTMCAYNTCSVAIRSMLFFTSGGINWASFALSLHFSKNHL